MMVWSVAFADCNLVMADTGEVQANTTAYLSAAQGGPLQNAKDGAILQCWDWSYNAIKDSIPEIAAAGYTSVQTSPVQRPKEYGKSCTNREWWKVYQPTTLSFANDGESWFGTKAEFKAMCDEAEQYGVKVIVDVVLNHMANNTGKIGNSWDDISTQNDPAIRNNANNWHLNGSTHIDYGNEHRGDDNTSLTHGFGGWPDLNTGSTDVQNAELALLKECVDLGADGFRFDAAKHIELPGESGGSDFWPNITNGIKTYAQSKGKDVYLYGEILDNCATDIGNYTKYIAVTDNRAGNRTRDGIKNYNIGDAANSSLFWNGQNADNLVLWAESHDTYANDNFTGPSTQCNQQQINRAWAIINARDFAALYYARPSESDKDAPMGTKTKNTSYKDKEVAEVNKFHNIFTGQSEYMSSSDNSVVVVERGTTGVVLVNIGGGSKGVNAQVHNMKDGKYTDHITGSEFNVSGGKISGNIGDTGIAVVYSQPNPDPTPTATPGTANGTTTYTSDSISVSIGLSNATSGTYSIDGGAAKTYTSSTQLTLGEGKAAGETTTLVLTATDGTKSSGNVTFKYQKTEPSNNIAYLKLPSGWSTDVYCYAYDSATEKVNNGTWPGQQMTLDPTTGYYKYEVPENIKAPRVIFYNSAQNRYPADQEKGLLFETDGSWLYADGKWEKMPAIQTDGKVTVNYVDESGNTVAASETKKGKIGTAYTTSAATVTGYNLSKTPSNASGTYTKADITVTYVYTKVVITDPLVNSSLATGSTFTDETKTITLSLQNAVSGTYSVDNGPVKTFTSSASVVLGQGKVADSTVTVDATATDTNGKTLSYTFTYNKKFNGTVNETEASNAKYNTAQVSQKLYNDAATKLASQYSTNKAGNGANKTITVDGDISDWNNSMIIAQGAANDDPRVYRENSMYEVPIDLYTLYGTWDNDNLYLMWEMTNVQDVVAPSDNYPLSQGHLYQTQNLPFFIAIDTGKSATRIGNSGKTATGTTLWNSGISIESDFNKLIAISTNAANGPFVYGGDSAGLNTVEEYGPKTAGVNFKYGEGILSNKVVGIDKGYGTNNNRVLGDMCNESASWVDFNTKGHDSTGLDFHYEMSIPLETLGLSGSDVQKNGLGVLLVSTFGKSGMDCLPYDLSMNDNANLPDTTSQANNSFEKSDEDNITTSFARVGKAGIVIPDELELNFGADKSAPQLTNTALTLNGIAQGGTAPYTYKYYVNNSLVATKSGSSSTTTTWTPSTAGTYSIKCVVTDADNTSVTSTKNYYVEGNNTELTANLKINGSTSQINNNIGDKVNIVATANGGSGSYTYRFIVHNLTTDSWSEIGSNNTGIFTHSNTSAGTREYLVAVKDGSGTEVKTNIIKIVTGAGALTASIKLNGGTSQINNNGGSTVNIVASADGGNGSYTYRFLVHNITTGAWSEIGSNNTGALSHTIGSAGTRDYYVAVTDGSGVTVKTSTIRVITGSTQLTASLKLNGTANQINNNIGNTVNIVTSANGGSGSYTYKFIVHNVTSNMWTELGSNTTGTFNHTIGSAGTREYYVAVQDGSGVTVKTNIVKVVTGSSVLNATLKINGTTSTIINNIGNTVNIVTSANGGSGNYTYRCVVHNTTTGSWTLLGTNSTGTFNHTLGTAGTREYYVAVTDASGSIVKTNMVKVITQ